MRQLGPAAIDRWLETIGSLAPATRRRQLSAVRGFCKWLVDKRHIPKDPTEHVPPIRQPRRVPVTLRREDVARLLDACPDARARAIVHLMVGCGLRCVEVSRLTTADYDGEARTIVVVGKGGHQRIVPVPDTVAAALDEYLNEVGRTSGPLIRSEADDRAPLKAGTISIYTGRWIVAAGIKSRRWDGLSAHGLRRTAASDVMDRGADVRIVQAMLGHVKIETTAVYLRPVPLDRMREAMEGRDYTSSSSAA